MRREIQWFQKFDDDAMSTRYDAIYLFPFLEQSQGPIPDALSLIVSYLQETTFYLTKVLKTEIKCFQHSPHFTILKKLLFLPENLVEF